jgi:hypothetical protein
MRRKLESNDKVREWRNVVQANRKAKEEKDNQLKQQELKKQLNTRLQRQKA